LTEAHSKPRYFGTDGMRGVANREPLTPERLLAIGRALGRLAKRRGGGIVLCRDPRRSSSLLVAAVSAGAVAEGANVTDFGMLPTPALAALIRKRNLGIGVVVSASHNPMQDNGIKVLASDGAKLPDADELWLETEMERAPASESPIGAGVGAIEFDASAVDAYLDHLVAAFHDLDLAGMHVVLDCANGATSAAAPRLFARLGARVTALNADPDGLNINAGCGAVHPERLAFEVKSTRAAIGLAFDGDGDRLIAVSGDGVIRDGDAMLYVCARQMAAAGRLKDKVVVGTVMTNFGLELALTDLGGKLIRTPVGDRHVAQRMREGLFDLGGEPSGHLIFGATNHYVGDGLWSALALLRSVRAAGASFAELASTLTPVPQKLENLKVRTKPPLDSIAPLKAAIAGAEAKLGSSGRVLVRYSGTENLLRVMVEGRDARVVEDLAASLTAIANRELNGE
jgi:phosphoglucosamine mutase